MKVYDAHGMPSQSGTGIFPREVMNRFPLLPLEEEGWLLRRQGPTGEFHRMGVCLLPLDEDAARRVNDRVVIELAVDDVSSAGDERQVGEAVECRL